jgi:hypothetical protein
MTDPTTNNRVAAKRQLVTLIGLAATADSSLAVSYGLPAVPPQELIAVLQADGQVETPYMKAGRKMRQDTFTVTIGCFAYRPGMAADEAEDRCGQLIAYVDDVVARNPNLPPLAKITSATVRRIEGPNSGANREGYLAHAFVDVEIVQQLS